jgi:hypothetical protein
MLSTAPVLKQRSAHVDFLQKPDTAKCRIMGMRLQATCRRSCAAVSAPNMFT